jgi:glycosyltransferase involved in cell wall biosynthesis
MNCPMLFSRFPPAGFAIRRPAGFLISYRFAALMSPATTSGSGWITSFWQAFSGGYGAVIPNGVDTQCYHPEPSKMPGRQINLLSTGRLITRKRIDWLIEAVGHAVRGGLDIRLTIVGEGNLLDELRKKAAAMNLSDRVVFMGLIERRQMPDVYRANDIFVMASQHEGMSNAMLEAIASGLPVVTTACEGAEELIGDNGILVNYPDSQAFAAAIKTIALDTEKYKAMSRAGRSIAEKYSWSAVADEYVQYYKQLVR